MGLGMVGVYVDRREIGVDDRGRSAISRRDGIMMNCRAFRKGNWFRTWFERG
jgi:hypothetical protein